MAGVGGVATLGLCFVLPTRSPCIKRQLMTVYGYKESSFKNFATNDKRSRSVPARFKLQMLMASMSEEAHFQVLQFALDLGNQSLTDDKGYVS